MNKKEIDIQNQRKGSEIFEGKINWTCVRGSCDKEIFPFWDLVTPTIIELRDKQEAWLKQDLKNWHYLEDTYSASWDPRESGGFNEIRPHLYVPHQNENISAIQRQKIQDEMELAEAHYWVKRKKEQLRRQEKRTRINKLAYEILAAEKPRRRQTPPRPSQNHLKNIRENLRKDCD